MFFENFFRVCIITSALFRIVEGYCSEIDREFDFNFLQPLASFLAAIKCQYLILSASVGGSGGGDVCFAKSIKSPSVTALLGTSFKREMSFRLPNLSQRCMTDLQSWMGRAAHKVCSAEFLWFVFLLDHAMCRCDVD